MKTIEQVLALFPDTKARKWKRHSNGGGWVYSTATVAKTAFVGEDALVYDTAQVYKNARVFGNAQVFGDAWISGKAQVFGNAHVFGSAQVSGNALVYDNARVWSNAQVFYVTRVHDDARVFGDTRVYGTAQVFGDALVYGTARVFGDSWKKSPPYIQGSRDSLTLSSFTEITIGCKLLSITNWKEHYRAIGRANRYTPEEIREYGEYINLLSKAAERLRKEEKSALKKTKRIG